MYKARGKIKILRDNVVREITVSGGKITGDFLLQLEVEVVLGSYEKRGGRVGAAMYKPKTKKYIEDETAVLLVIREVCSEVQFSGQLPELVTAAGEGDVN